MFELAPPSSMALLLTQRNRHGTQAQFGEREAIDAV
jgi:hypothetical protein